MSRSFLAFISLIALTGGISSCSSARLSEHDSENTEFVLVGYFFCEERENPQFEEIRARFAKANVNWISLHTFDGWNCVAAVTSHASAADRILREIASQPRYASKICFPENPPLPNPKFEDLGR